jgi:alkylation response protein AidB-like acyl-CoA dehydrogenase
LCLGSCGTLDGGRINIGACSLGAAWAALDKAREYMFEVHQILEGTNEIMRVVISRKLLGGNRG